MWSAHVSCIYISACGCILRKPIAYICTRVAQGSSTNILRGKLSRIGGWLVVCLLRSHIICFLGWRLQCLYGSCCEVCKDSAFVDVPALFMCSLDVIAQGIAPCKVVSWNPFWERVAGRVEREVWSVFLITAFFRHDLASITLPSFHHFTQPLAPFLTCETSAAIKHFTCMPKMSRSNS